MLPRPLSIAAAAALFAVGFAACGSAGPDVAGDVCSKADRCGSLSGISAAQCKNVINTSLGAMSSGARSDAEKAYSACVGMDCSTFNDCVDRVMQGSGGGTGGSATGGTGGNAAGGTGGSALGGTGGDGAGGTGGSAIVGTGGDGAGGTGGSAVGGSAGGSSGGRGGSAAGGTGGSAAGGRGGAAGSPAGTGGSATGSAGTGGSGAAVPEL